MRLASHGLTLEEINDILVAIAIENKVHIRRVGKTRLYNQALLKRSLSEERELNSALERRSRDSRKELLGQNSAPKKTQLQLERPSEEEKNESKMPAPRQDRMLHTKPKTSSLPQRSALFHHLDLTKTLIKKRSVLVGSRSRGGSLIEQGEWAPSRYSINALEAHRLMKQQ